MVVPMVSAINKPVFESPVLSYKNLSYNLSWVSSDNATYRLFFNNSQIYASSINSYVFWLGNLSSGNFSLFVNATDQNGSDLNFGWLFFTANSAPTKPGLVVPSQVDISSGPVIFNITASVDINLDPIIYALYMNDLNIANFTGLQYSSVSFSEGDFSFKVCASDGYSQICSDPVAVGISNGTIPQINSVSYSYGIPFYGDKQIRNIAVLVELSDFKELRVNASFYASGDDYYDEDFDNVTGLTCAKIGFSGNLKTYNCSVSLSYLMQPGFYDVRVDVSNGIKSATKVFQKKMGVGTLLSYGVSSPKFDFGNTYNGWTYTDPVANITNLGNVPFSDVGVELSNMSCPHEDDFLLSSLKFSKRDNRGSALSAENGFQWLDLIVLRGSFYNLFFFLNNPDEVSPDHDCEAKWKLKFKYVAG